MTVTRAIISFDARRTIAPIKATTPTTAENRTLFADSDIGGSGRFRSRPLVDELEAEPALYAQMTTRDRRVERRGDLQDPFVLDVQVDGTADTAVRTDRRGDPLRRGIPGAGLTHVVLGLGHQRAGRAHADAVAAVDARRFGQRDGLLGRDAGVESAAGDRDREGVLGILAARLDALVAEDAFRVVADIEVVVDLRRLRDGGCERRLIARRRVVVPGVVGVPLAGVGGS